MHQPAMSDQATDQPRDYLLLISLGPVQEFIAAGRKTRDLFAGSRMLSELSRHVAQFVGGRTGADGQPVTIIFPGPTSVSNPKVAAANKILARVNATPKEVRSLADDARRDATAHLHEAWDAVLTSLSPGTKRIIAADVADDQIRAFLEWYAVWTPFDPAADESAGDSYHQRRGRIEPLLGGRKALRGFAPAHGVEGVPKSALDASRESVIVRGALDFPRNATINDPARKRANGIQRELRLKGNEQLDAISSIKRLGKARFVSVSRVAFDPFIRRAAAHGQQPMLQTLSNLAKALDDHNTDLAETFAADGKLAHFKDFPFDCQLFYETPESVRWLLDRDQDPPLDDADKHTAHAFVDTVHQLKKALDVPDPPAYFAVLRADGDRMGRILNHLKDSGHHQSFSD